MNLTEGFSQSVRTVRGVKNCYLQGTTAVLRFKRIAQTPKSRPQKIKFPEDFAKVRKHSKWLLF